MTTTFAQRRVAYAAVHDTLGDSDYVRNCESCGDDLYPTSPLVPLGFFMLVEPLWAVASLDGEIACLCLDCTETALGTRLPSWAFDIANMAPPALLTPALQDRLNPFTDRPTDCQLSVSGRRANIAARVFPAAAARS